MMEQQPTVSVRQASEPRSGEWVVEWWSPLIAGPSYLYFTSREQAEQAAERIIEQRTAASLDSSPAAGSEETSAQMGPAERTPAREVLDAGRRLLRQLPEDMCAEAATSLREALQRLEDEVAG